MSLELFNWLMLGLFVFTAAMVVVRFAFYRKQARPMSAVYFWGACLFLLMAVADLSSSLFYGTDLHGWQTTVFCGLTVWTLYLSLKNRRVLQTGVNA